MPLSEELESQEEFKERFVKYLLEKEVRFQKFTIEHSKKEHYDDNLLLHIVPTGHATITIEITDVRNQKST